MKALEQETWPFDHAVEEPLAAVEEVSEEKNDLTNEQSGFFNKLKGKIFPTVWRTA